MKRFVLGGLVFGVGAISYSSCASLMAISSNTTTRRFASMTSAAGMIAAHAMIGRRDYMEDEFSMTGAELKNGQSVTVVGVYDGHGGERTSKLCRERMPLNILMKLNQSISDGDNSKQTSSNTNKLEKEKIDQALLDAFKATENDYYETIKPKNAFEGSTACVALITERDIFVANAGDSRCVLCSKNKKVALSRDHKPDRPDEHERLKNEGAYVQYQDCPRVYLKNAGGGLAMSRAIGDSFYGAAVPCTPEIVRVKRTDDDTALVIGSDGLFDVLNEKEICKIVSETLSGPDPATVASKALMLYAYKKGSWDNITALVVIFDHKDAKKTPAKL